MKLLSKTLVESHTPARSPVIGGISYVHPEKPHLLRRVGQWTQSDVQDDFFDEWSEDNGATWSSPTPSLPRKRAEGGAITHTEHALLYLAKRDLLIHVTNDLFIPDDENDTTNYPNAVRITTGTPSQVAREEGCDVFISGYGLDNGCYISFCQPIEDSRGRILIPIQHRKNNASGERSRI